MTNNHPSTTHRVSVECPTFRTLLVTLYRHDANTPAQDRTQLGVAELVNGAVGARSASSERRRRDRGLQADRVLRRHRRPAHRCPGWHRRRKQASSFGALTRSVRHRMNLLDLVGQHEWCLFGCHRVSRMVAQGATILDGQMPMFPNQVGASELIGHSTKAFVQSTPQALRELGTGNRPLFGRKTGARRRK